MDVFLNEQGWNDGIDSLGVWSNQADVIEADSISAVDVAGTINTRRGNDELLTRRSFVQNSIEIINTDLNTGAGSDRIFGDSVGNIGILIENGNLKTGSGDDDISSFAQAGVGIVFSGSSQIDTGRGNDEISGETDDGGGSGIFLSGSSTIYTRGGDDKIIGSSDASPGIILSGSSAIYTGKGNDEIIGSNSFDSNSGIILDDSSKISTGKGDDVVDALTGGFLGSGSIHLGKGKDSLKGFVSPDFNEVVDSGIFDGGRGEDTLVLPSGSYKVSLGSSNIVSFIKDDNILNTANFEILTNTDGSQTFDFAALMDSEIIDL